MQPIVKIQANTKENIYTRCGPEFGEHQHSIAVIVRAGYALTTTIERFKTCWLTFSLSLDLNPIVLTDIFE